MTTEPIYTASDAERSFAADWHGGQASMLYAVASTGGLSRGTCRPRWSSDEPFTDAEWSRDLVARLRAEIDECNPRYPEDGRDSDVRLSWELKLQQVAAALDLAEELAEYPIVHESGAVELHESDPRASVCGHCGRGWDDSVSTSVTPVPAGRCPFEYDHEECD